MAKLTPSQRVIKDREREKISELVRKYKGRSSLREFQEVWNENLPREHWISYQSIANWVNGTYSPDRESVLPLLEYYEKGDEVRELAERLLRILDDSLEKMGVYLE